MNEIISSSILLILIMDPIGNLPIFMSMLKYFPVKRQKIIIIRELSISLFLMLIFLFTGEKVLAFLNLNPESVSISGSIIMFLISIHMIFPNSKNYNNTLQVDEEPFIIPLAIPLVSGPSIFATLMLLTHKYSNHIIHLVIALFLSWGVTLIVLLQSSRFLLMLGKKWINLLERLMGLIMIMMSVQMFLDGISSWIKLIINCNK